MSCGEEIIYQDENVCILNPNSGKGVEVMHAVGYMEPIRGTYFDILTTVAKDGLKSTRQLLKERDLKHLNNRLKPKNNISSKTNNNNNNNNNYNNSDDEDWNISLRQGYLKYNEKHFDRIFLRPPMSAPYKLENDKLISAGDWRNFLKDPRAHRLFFGGRSYIDFLLQGSSESSLPQGLVTLRVDPDKTYVFYEGMKSMGNIDHETGMFSPNSWRKPPKSRERFKETRTLLSEHLDNLQKNPGKTEADWEIMITTPNIPACAFEKIISNSKEYKDKIGIEYFKDQEDAIKKGLDTPQLDEDLMIEKQRVNNMSEKEEKGSKLRKEAYSFIKPFRDFDNKIRKLRFDILDEYYKLNKIYQKITKKTKDINSSNFDTTHFYEMIREIEEDYTKFSKIFEDGKKNIPNFIPIQRVHIDDNLKNIVESINKDVKQVRELKDDLEKLPPLEKENITTITTKKTTNNAVNNPVTASGRPVRAVRNKTTKKGGRYKKGYFKKTKRRRA
jgi:hypothetical protein